MLKFEGMPTTTAPAPPSAERYPISQRSTVVWTGRLPALRVTSWLVTVAFVTLQWWLVGHGMPVILAIVATPVTSAWALMMRQSAKRGWAWLVVIFSMNAR